MPPLGDDATMIPFSASVHELPADGPAVVRCQGELDGDAAAGFTATLDGLSAAEVTIDLRDVAFMDSEGARCLVRAQKDLTAAGRTLEIVVRYPSSVASLLRVAALDRVLPVRYDPPLPLAT